MTYSNNQILQDKIRQFVKKYYQNELYKGIIYFVLIVLSAFIAFSLFEYFSYSNSVIRSILFYGFIALFAANLVFYIILPLCKLAGLGKQISNEEIAQMADRIIRIEDGKVYGEER